MPPEAGARRWQRIALGSVLALIIFGLAWELIIAPLRPGGSWLALKVVPLLFALPGLRAGRRYTFQWAAMLALAYFAEGVVRAWSDTGLSQWLGGVEILLSVTAYVAMVIYCKVTRGNVAAATAQSPR